MSLGCRKHWFGIPTLPLLICYLFWAELLNDSKPQFPHLYNGRSYSVSCGEAWMTQCMRVCINIYNGSTCGQVVLHSAQYYQGFKVALAVVVDVSGFVSASHLFWHGCVPVAIPGSFLPGIWSTLGPSKCCLSGHSSGVNPHRRLDH